MNERAPARCDVAIRDGTVIDGTGEVRRAADVAITGDRIVAVGDLGGTAAAREIDATGRIVAPGFIDVHTHDDRALLSGPDMSMKVSQGVTSVIIGNCGVSLSPIVLERPPPPPMNLLGDQSWYRFATTAAYVEEVERRPAALNAALLIGHSTLRVGTMDTIDGAATDAEIVAMGGLLAEGMAAGALGFSTGLFYPTNSGAPTDEVVALAEVASRAGGMYVTHMRNEHDGVAESLDETFEIGQRADMPVVISHHKCAGARNFGRTRETLAKIDAARAEQDVGLDVYPYAAGSTALMSEMLDGEAKVLITWSTAKPEMAGRYLSEIAAELGISEMEAADRLQPAGAVYFMMDEYDVQRILSYPHSMIGSDGIPHDERPHPRLWGTFPRVLGHYARELGLFSLEEAVRKMTGLSAARFGLVDRGEVRAGAFADLVIFDAETVADRATYADPIQPAAGIDRVIVNGLVIWEDGAASGERPGRILKRAA